MHVHMSNNCNILRHAIFKDNNNNNNTFEENEHNGYTKQEELQCMPKEKII